METLRVQVDEKKARLVRKKAMEAYGHSKGSISKAVNVALDKWIYSVEGKTKRISARELTGIASDLKDSSLAAQKKALRYMGTVD
ncbi:MAG: hypothetical protein HY392_02380 [Candidatus Diapherotrites archaeon]|nr:hypothetical protein [Candidatus Diapherotrites archaeon]